MFMTKYYIGISGWSYADWCGRFYPATWPKRRWFEYYATQFSTVEINATFYRKFSDQVYSKWYIQAPADFRYILKVPQLITHSMLLNDTQSDIAEFCQLSNVLKEKLALYLLQLSPQMPYDLNLLQHALNAFQDPKKVVIEFRHNQWLTHECEFLLKKIGSILCIVDSPCMQPVPTITSPIAYIRLHGRKHWYNYDYSIDELKGVVRLAKLIACSGVQQIYIFFNNTIAANAPINALTLMELLL
jgi:uncharacterized protein YecE (DUF72 family)